MYQKSASSLFLKKQRRIKSQEDYQMGYKQYEDKVVIEIQAPESHPTRLIFRKGTKMSDVKAQLKRKIGKGLSWFSITMDHNFDYCLEEEIGEIHNSIRLRYQKTDEEVVEENNLHAYKIYKCISVGGFSKVFLVRSKKTGKFFAAKFIEKTINEDPKFRDLIENQRQINTILDHPFICKMHNFIQTTNFYIFVLDYCPAGELFGLMKNHRDMTESQAKFYFIETILAINYMHQRNIMYRDIKPQNILLDKKGHIKIADLGLAKVVREKSHSYCGSLQYMAPEIVKGDQYAFGVDYYCLGSLLFEMMVGCPPFYNPDFLPEETKHHIVNSEVKFPYRKMLSTDFKDFVKKLLDKNQKTRLGSLGGIKEILSHPWIGKFNKQSFQTYKISAPYAQDLSQNNFQTEYLPNDEIVETIKKIKADLKMEINGDRRQSKFSRDNSIKNGSTKCTSITHSRKLSNKNSLKRDSFNNKGSRNLISLLSTGLRVRKSREKRRTKSSQNVSENQIKEIFKKANEKYKTTSPFIQASSVNLSVYLQKTIHHVFSSPSSQKNRSLSRSIKDNGQKNKKTTKTTPYAKIQVKNNAKMLAMGGLKKNCREGKQNIFKSKFEEKSKLNYLRGGLRASDCPEIHT